MKLTKQSQTMKPLKKMLSRKFILFAVGLLLLCQLIAYFYLGLGSIPIYVENKYYEYIYAPNQDLHRFGNHIKTNSLGLRSPEFNKKDKIRILKIGDSVINGGAHVDQDNLSSSLLTKMLTQDLKKQIGVYNISAQSWGPDNAFEFIKQHGDFNANIFLLVFSSHDLHDNMHFKKVVGNHKAWPNAQPLCALTDAWYRYAWPKVKSFFGGKSDEYDYLFDFDNSKLNSGWKNFINYAAKNKIKLIVYLHPTKNELKNKSYDKYGKQIIQMLDSNNIQLIKGMELGMAPNSYRDMIHLNEQGHKDMAKGLSPILKTCINNLSFKE
jgi:hypothetical protein